MLLCKDLETPLRSGIVLFRAKISDFGLSIVREIEEPFKRKKPNLNASKDGNGVEDGDVPYYRDLSSKQSRLQKQLVRDMATNNENISLEIAVNLTRDRATTIQQAVSPTYCTSANFSVLSAVVLNGGTKVYMVKNPFQIPFIIVFNPFPSL